MKETNSTDISIVQPINEDEYNELLRQAVAVFRGVVRY